MRSKVSRNFVLLAPPSCGEVSANKSANVGALIFIVILFGSVLIIAYHPPFVQRFLKYASMLDVDFVWVHQASTVPEATLGYSLNSIGVKTLVVEAGVGMRITQDYCQRLVNGILNLMSELGMWDGPVQPVKQPIVSLDRSVSFVNAEEPGVFVPTVRHSDNVRKGEIFGCIVDALSGEVRQECVSEVDGLLFTLRENPIVNKGSLIARILQEERR